MYAARGIIHLACAVRFGLVARWAGGAGGVEQQRVDGEAGSARVVVRQGVVMGGRCARSVSHLQDPHGVCGPSLRAAAARGSWVEGCAGWIRRVRWVVLVD